MPLVPFYSKCRDLAFEETRTVLLRNHESLPDGTYGFLEFYCNEIGCDCRRVLVQVIRPDTGSRVWASINFGWETPTFYRRWASGNPADADEMATATLDPINLQSRHSNALLRLFSDIVLADGAYVQRLQRHYELFKRAAGPKRDRVATRTKRRRNSKTRDGV
jgi:hypothetical protein